ncbi:MAG: lipoyl(octanoyl) transferase LipB [Deltaproteobacteria bacterium]|nr:lipoyl(octanoyl) transferase LipB [Deltaproteobacteria bacterium]TLN04603.1 MAG: lipoyl(octanoyl) transferase LipB [bacterium]
MLVKELGTVGYGEAFALQENLTVQVQENIVRETLLLLEHPLVYTMGRSGSDANILDPSVEVIRINRGGDITCHGPGQLVGYPIINLGRRGKDLRRHLRFLEEILILTSADFGVPAYRVEGRTGIWTDSGKLASIGVGVRHWVTMHGFALNVNNDLAAFSRINPCGISSCPIASMESLRGCQVPLQKVSKRIAERFAGMLEEWMPQLKPEQNISSAENLLIAGKGNQ